MKYTEENIKWIDKRCCACGCIIWAIVFDSKPKKCIKCAALENEDK